MSVATLFAMSDAAGTVLTIALIVIIALVLGVLVISSDDNWFD